MTLTWPDDDIKIIRMSRRRSYTKEVKAQTTIFKLKNQCDK